MRVLIITSIFPPDIGGPATYVPKMAECFLKERVGVRVIAFSDREFYTEDLSLPYKLLRIPRGNSFWKRHFKYYKELLKIVPEADVLFVNSVSLLLHSFLANLFYRKPLVLKFVGDWVWEKLSAKGVISEPFEEFLSKRHSFKIELFKKFRNMLLKIPDKIIVPSFYLKNCLIKMGVEEEKIKVIYNAIDLPEEAGLKEQAGLPFRGIDFIILTVCRLVPFKGVSGIINVMIRLPENVGLIVIGDGPEREKLESMVKNLSLENRVYFTGILEKKKVFSFLRRGTLFVLNSLYEGLPHVIIEALMAGLPVVATNVGGTPEVVKDGVSGFLIPPGDEEALYRAIKRFIDNPDLLEKMPDKEEIRRLKELFSVDRMVKETLEVLRVAR